MQKLCKGRRLHQQTITTCINQSNYKPIPSYPSLSIPPFHGISNFQKEHFTFYETSDNVLYE